MSGFEVLVRRTGKGGKHTFKPTSPPHTFDTLEEATKAAERFHAATRKVFAVKHDGILHLNAEV